MLITDRPAADVEALRDRLHGEVHGPLDAGYNEARRAWNLAIDQRPAMVALPITDADVIATVEFAREHGLRIVAQTTGHGAISADLTHTILVCTKRMRGVRIDPGARTARVRAGAVWGDVTGPASSYGLAPLAGTAPDAGVVGSTLSGGVSWLGRRYGLACHSLTAIEIVTGDGRHVRTDADREPELFWALTGGGGGFGVVTAMEFELHPAHKLHGGALMWPIERAEEIFSAWRDWTQTVPDEVTSICRVLNLGPHSFVLVEAAVLGDPQILEPLQALNPQFGEFGALAAQLGEIHSDPKEPTAYASGRVMLDALPDGAIAALVAMSAQPLVSVELRHLGGALARPVNGALDRLRGAYDLFAVGATPDAQTSMDVDVAITRLIEAFAPWDAGRPFAAATRHRLRTVKARADGDGLFTACCA